MKKYFYKYLYKLMGLIMIGVGLYTAVMPPLNPDYTKTAVTYQGALLVFAIGLYYWHNDFNKFW